MIVLTTFSLHKLVMESRIRVLETRLNETYGDKFSLEKKVSEMKEKYSQTIDQLEQNL